VAWWRVAFDTSKVSPWDAAVTLRSFPRRFRTALTLPEDEQRPDDVVHRRPHAGVLSAAEHAAWTASAIREVDTEFRKVMIEHDPELDLPPVDVAPPVAGGEDPTDAVLARLESAATSLADRIGDVHGEEWSRTGRLPGSDGAKVSALDVVRLSVQIGVEHLRAAERTVADVAREVGGRDGGLGEGP
jgi:hypothetical protein